MKTLLNFRKEHSLNSSQMAKILGITLSYYRKIEKGTRNPSYNFILKFKEVFPNANVDDIFFKSKLDEMSKNKF